METKAIPLLFLAKDPHEKESENWMIDNTGKNVRKWEL